MQQVRFVNKNVTLLMRVKSRGTLPRHQVRELKHQTKFGDSQNENEHNCTLTNHGRSFTRSGIAAKNNFKRVSGRVSYYLTHVGCTRTFCQHHFVSLIRIRIAVDRFIIVTHRGSLFRRCSHKTAALTGHVISAGIFIIFILQNREQENDIA